MTAEKTDAKLAPFEAQAIETERQVASFERELTRLLEKTLTPRQVEWLEAYLRDGHGNNAFEGVSKKYLARLTHDYLNDENVALAISLTRRIAVWRARVNIQAHVSWLDGLVMADFTELKFDRYGEPLKTTANLHLWKYVQSKRVRKIPRKDHVETVIEFTTPSKLEACRVLLGIAGLDAGSLAPEVRTEARPVVAGVSLGDVLALPKPKTPEPPETPQAGGIIDAEVVTPDRA